MDAFSLKVITAAVFILVYLLIVLYYRLKAWIIWGGVAAMLLIGAVTLRTAFSSINWDVIGIYVGMLFIAEALVISKVPDYLAIWVTNKSSKVWSAMLLVCMFTGILSIVVENVACVLIVAPIIFSIAKRIKVSPIPMIIGAAVSSNLQGVATLIGDPPSMLLASHAKLTFNDFFFFQGKLGLFFAVQIGMIASLFVLYFFFRKYSHHVGDFKEAKVKSLFPALMLLSMIVALAVASFFNGGRFRYSSGAVCLIFGAICLVWIIRRLRKAKQSVYATLKDMDWITALFILAIFIVVDSLTQTGIIKDLALLIYSITGSSVFFAFVLIVIISVFLSAFVDNVPYIVAMLPVTQIVAEQAAVSPYVLYFGLLIGASVGGNITPIGASANIVGVGLLNKKGYHTSFWDFVKIGLPFTLISVAASAAFVWLMYGF
ncbi:MAG: SLC13 family permease [Candidatus Woesearchaeota archaeon]